MEIEIGFQALKCRGAGLKCKDGDTLAFAMKKHGRQPNIGSYVEDAVSVVQLDTVLHVASFTENFPVNKARFIRIQREHR